MVAERRKLPRKGFTYYMRVMDEVTGKMIGHLADISTGGFKLESERPLPTNMEFRLRIDQLGDIANKTALIFKARSRWCQRDFIDPNSYNVGFQILDMSPSDYEVFLRMFDVYGSKAKNEADKNVLW